MIVSVVEQPTSRTKVPLYHFNNLIKRDSQGKAFRVQGDFNLPSPSVPCLFVGENKKERLPSLSLRPFLYPFTNCIEYHVGILAATAKMLLH